MVLHVNLKSMPMS
ncbi:hypothetical protein F383_32066 [Gossypium arboreum]|nr:hypothetical protein F383_32066 [Gossypium arboreum]